MAELKRYTSVGGDIPWTMTQNQRGPTCGCTTIAVAYRILTGWTVFPTKGNYRQFSSDLRQIELQKGDEGILSVREAAKFDQVSSAGEIVNADDMATVINTHAEGVRADVVEVEGKDIGAAFVESVSVAFERNLAPLVLFYVDGPTDNIGRQYNWQHWVNIYAVEKNGEWLFTPITNLSFKQPLSLKKKPTKGEMLIWTWGRAYVVDGAALGEASALSIDWESTPRMWTKDLSGKDVGKMNWKEIVPTSDEYVDSKPSSKLEEVRYTSVKPLRPLEKHGFVVMSNT